MASLTESLTNRHSELHAICAGLKSWNEIQQWHSKCQPLIAGYFPDHLESYNSLIAVKFKRPPISLPQGVPLVADELEAEAVNDALIKNAYQRLDGFLATLIEMQTIPGSVEVDTTESDSLFETLLSIVTSSRLPQQFKNAVTYDLTDARSANRGGAYKSCVVMLGAALEGLMLGTLQRTDVLTSLANSTSPPGPIGRVGTKHPQLGDKIGNDLTFEDYKVCVHDLIAGSDALGVDNIQAFRNAIHPWKTIQEPMKYGAFDRARALHYLASLQKIAEVLCDWTP